MLDLRKEIEKIKQEKLKESGMDKVLEEFEQNILNIINENIKTEPIDEVLSGIRLNFYRYESRIICSVSDTNNVLYEKRFNAVDEASLIFKILKIRFKEISFFYNESENFINSIMKMKGYEKTNIPSDTFFVII